MLCALLATTLLTPPRNLNILFLGNSHTGSNDLTGMVKSLIESDGTRTQVQFKVHGAGFLEDLAQSSALRKDLQSGDWDVVVMQGAKLSSSHKYEYDHSGAVQIAKFAKQNKVKAYLFAEWPRRGWNESTYIMKEYREISEPSGATIIPVCYAWDSFLKEQPKAQLWAGDGNHASLSGSYLAACTIAMWLGSKEAKTPTWVQRGVPSNLDLSIKAVSKAIVDRYRK